MEQPKSETDPIEAPTSVVSESGSQTFSPDPLDLTMLTVFLLDGTAQTIEVQEATTGHDVFVEYGCVLYWGEMTVPPNCRVCWIVELTDAVNVFQAVVCDSYPPMDPATIVNANGEIVRYVFPGDGSVLLPGNGGLKRFGQRKPDEQGPKPCILTEADLILDDGRLACTVFDEGYCVLLDQVTGEYRDFTAPGPEEEVDAGTGSEILQEIYRFLTGTGFYPDLLMVLGSCTEEPSAPSEAFELALIAFPLGQATEFYLGPCCIPSSCGPYFGGMVAHAEALILSCKFEGDGLEILGAALNHPSCTVRKLEIAGDHYNPEETQQMIALLTGNTKIRKLELEMCFSPDVQWEALLGLQSLTDLSLRTPDDGSLGSLAGLLPRLQELCSLEKITISCSDQDPYRLDSPELRGLSNVLSLPFEIVELIGIDLSGAGDLFRGMKQLSLCRCKFDQFDVRMLECVESLIVFYTDYDVFLRDSQWPAFAEGFTSKPLRSLAFPMMDLPSNIMLPILEAVRCNPANILESLDLSYNNLDVKCIATVAELVASSPFLQVLDLNTCGINDEGAIILARKLASTSSLVELRLENNAIHDEGAYALVNAIVLGGKSTVEVLQLDSIGITSAGCTVLRAIFKGVQLKDLLGGGC